jgi:hypothetical protein
VTAPTAGSKSALTPCAFTAALHGVVEIEQTRSRSDRQDGHVLIRLQAKIETDSGAPTAPSGLQIENSNPKPCRYERATFTETSNDYWHFRAGSLTNVRVWLRRSIGYLLVGREAGLGSANPNGLRFSPQLTKQCSQVLPPEPIHKNVAHQFARQKNPGRETRRDRLLNLRLLPDGGLGGWGARFVRRAFVINT